MAKKQASASTKSCPVTKDQFLKKAKPLAINIDGQLRSADIKEFSSGSFGFYMGDKVTLEIDGVPVKFQCSMNLVAVGSKPAA